MRFTAQKLREYRKKAGLKERDIANFTGIDLSNYYHIEAARGRLSLSDATIEKLARVPELADVGLTEAKLKAWRLIDATDPSLMLVAIEELFPLRTGATQ